MREEYERDLHHAWMILETDELYKRRLSDADADGKCDSRTLVGKRAGKR